MFSRVSSDIERSNQPTQGDQCTGKNHLTEKVLRITIEPEHLGLPEPLECERAFFKRF
jgi:hypothetical protein